MKSYIGVLCLVAFASLIQAVTFEDYNSAKSELRGLVRADRARIGGFVRLAFHDCVGEGGCDGCINHQNTDNSGLQVYTNALDGLYDSNYNGKMSRADFYALSSIVALEEASTTVNDKFDGTLFQVGRQDCTTNPVEDGDEVFPLATMNYGQVVNYFSSEFELNADETIALMGAHTLGRARQANSGFEGPWVRGRNGPNVLNNEFYREMTNVPWEHVTSGDLNPQWQRPGTARNQPGQQNSNMFLSSDTCLVVNFLLGGDGLADCTMCGPRDRTPPNSRVNACCRPSEGNPRSLIYSRDNARWITDFTAVFYKMINKGEAALIPAPTEVTSTGAPPAPETPPPAPGTPRPPPPPSSRPPRPSPPPGRQPPPPGGRPPPPGGRPPPPGGRPPPPGGRPPPPGGRDGRAGRNKKRERSNDNIVKRLMKQLENIENEIKVVKRNL